MITMVWIYAFILMEVCYGNSHIQETIHYSPPEIITGNNRIVWHSSINGQVVKYFSLGDFLTTISIDSCQNFYIIGSEYNLDHKWGVFND